MARDEGNGSVNMVLAFLLGAASGAAIALLCAPAAGRETRRYLGEKAREGRGKASDAMERGREKLKEGRETLVNAVERGREAYQQARTQEKV